MTVVELDVPVAEVAARPNARRRNRRRLPTRGARTVAIAAALVVSPLVLGAAGLLSEYHALLVGFGAVYAMAALSLNLLMGYAGQVSLGHAAFLGIGAYASGWVTYTLEKPFVLGLVAAMAWGAIAALVVGFPALRIRGLQLALLTLAFGLAMAALVFRLRAVTGSAAGLALPRPQIGGHVLDDNRQYLAVLVAMAVALVWFDRNLLASKVGRAWKALRDDEDVAASFGIDVARFKLLAFVLSGAAAGAAGAGFGHLVGIAQVESFTVQLSVTFVIIVVLGGLGSRTGVLVAGVVFGVLPRFVTGLEGWDLVIAPALVALTIARYPGGMAQQWRELTHGRAEARARAGGHGEVDSDADPVPLTFRLSNATHTAAGDNRAPASVVPPLAVNGLTVAFGGLVAVHDLDLSVPAGEITGLIGPNGAGKSTVFNAVSGFVRPTAGRILVGGTDVTDLPPHDRAAHGLGRTFQLVGLVKSMSVVDNMLLAQHRAAGYRFGAALLRLPHAARREAELQADAVEIVRALGFEQMADQPLGSLSHGQQRIVEVACVLAARPRVLLLDEPTAGLSPAAAEALAERLLDLRDRLGQTILLIEHHIPVVQATCARLTIMVEGHELTTGTPADVLRDPRVVDAYLGGAVTA